MTDPKIKWRLPYTSKQVVAHAFTYEHHNFRSLCGKQSLIIGQWIIAKETDPHCPECEEFKPPQEEPLEITI
jgi:hypothetical protein